MPLVTRLGILLLIPVCGCAHSWHHGPASLAGGDAFAERRRLEKFDPLPATRLAPDTFVRPPGFDRTRTQARQAAELRASQGVPVLPDPGGPTFPSSKNEFPDVVRD